VARRLISNVDRPLIFCVLALAILGLYNLSSAGRPIGAELHQSQAVHVIAGLGLMALVASVHYRNLEVLAIPFFILSMGLLVGTDLFGKVVNGSRRWLQLGPVNLQTSDIAKLAVILVVARLFHLERPEQGGLTLREIFRPVNVSRPLIVVCAVLAATLGGDRVQPANLKQMIGRHHRTVASVSAKHPTIVVGRARESDLRLAFEGVSEKHAEIVRVGDSAYVLRDLGSEGGTFLNGVRIEGERALHHGDSIRFGAAARGEVQFQALIEKLRPYLPYVALLGAVWLFVALYAQFKRSGQWTIRDVIAPIDIVILPAVLILAQPDLGTTLVIVLVALTMMLYVGFRPLSLILLTVMSVVGSVAAWLLVLKPYQKDRVLTFLNPESDLAGAGYHQNQSMIAIGSGGLTGLGHGQGTQTQLSFLPEQQTDFIFSVWAEEQGFIGCAVVVILFLALILLALRITSQARDRFGALLAMGVTSLLFWHGAINMLMVLRLAPVVGVPLPLWSNGGSFVVTVLVGVGILLNVGMRRLMF
jgi:cell division protein FtsW (lipid II flippase)